MHRILTRSAAAAAGVLIPVILAVCALACTAPHTGAQSNTASRQTIAKVGLSYGHHQCRSYGKRGWSRSVKASAAVLSAQFSRWLSGSQGTTHAPRHYDHCWSYGNPGSSQSGIGPVSSQSGTQPSTSPTGTQPGTPPTGTQPTGTQPGTPPGTPATGLVAWDGLAPADLAVVLGCSPVAARSRLHRARCRLAARLGIDPGPQRHAPAGHKQGGSRDSLEVL
jgi:hypothetical protein